MREEQSARSELRIAIKDATANRPQFGARIEHGIRYTEDQRLRFGGTPMELPHAKDRWLVAHRAASDRLNLETAEYALRRGVPVDIIRRKKRPDGALGAVLAPAARPGLAGDAEVLADREVGAGEVVGGDDVVDGGLDVAGRGGAAFGQGPE